MAGQRAGAGVTATLVPPPFAELAIRAQAGNPAGGCGAGVREAREEAFARFAAVGIPTSKDEEWRFTPVRHLATTPFRSAGVSPRVTERDIAPFLVAQGRG